MAKGVADMNCLVTDKVRRTVKFLCALAKGVPIVTTHWLEKVSHNAVPVSVSSVSLCLCNQHPQLAFVLSSRVVRPGASCLLRLSL